ncbi:hypothetical protein RchiOBHm_Chr3g0469721 [Rosa chinensis]|uniref:Uncharacterized protein n=1 Tax=Rosa chinensis TaxID=74649 RepID=A0A2P6RAU5_ROSCH|nr:hypothetical protein RchiOBHm_Chr3g0469721 [Rosa chinensis]
MTMFGTIGVGLQGPCLVGYMLVSCLEFMGFKGEKSLTYSCHYLLLSLISICDYLLVSFCFINNLCFSFILGLFIEITFKKILCNIEDNVKFKCGGIVCYCFMIK